MRAKGGIALAGALLAIAAAATPASAATPWLIGAAKVDATATAFSAGGRTVALVSVIAQGIFDNYLDTARAEAQDMAQRDPACGHIDGLVISANHNESSPDTVGLYGPADPTGTAPLYSGIDEYYMSWLERRLARLLPPPARAGRGRRGGDVPRRRPRLDGGRDHGARDPGPALQQRRQRLLPAGRGDRRRPGRRRRGRAAARDAGRAGSGRRTADAVLRPAREQPVPGARRPGHLRRAPALHSLPADRARRP